jgi:hypothetical protein
LFLSELSESEVPLFLFCENFDSSNWSSELILIMMIMTSTRTRPSITIATTFF